MTRTQKAICALTVCLGVGLSPWFVPQAKAIGGKTSDTPPGANGETCSYTIGDTGDSQFGSGDDFYSSQNWGWCTDSWLASNAEAFGMKSKYWEGHGWDDACNENNPTGRMFNTIVALKNAGPPLDWESISFFPFELPEGYSFLHWAPSWVYNKLDDTRARCAFNRQDRVAFTHWHGAVDLYVPNFSHDISAPERAGTLVHETRHREGKGHAKGGNDKEWDGNGPWAYQAAWLMWYAFTAEPAPKGLKCGAGSEGESIYQVRFNEGPGPNYDLRSLCGP